MIDDYKDYPIEISYLLTYENYKSFMRNYNMRYILRIYPVFAVCYVIVINIFFDLAIISTNSYLAPSVRLEKTLNSFSSAFFISIQSLLFFTIIYIPILFAYFYRRRVPYREFFYDNDTVRVKVLIDKLAIDVEINNEPFEHLDNDQHFIPFEDKNYYMFIPESNDSKMIVIQKSKCPKEFSDYLSAKVKKNSTIKNLLSNRTFN